MVHGLASPQNASPPSEYFPDLTGVVLLPSSVGPSKPSLGVGGWHSHIMKSAENAGPSVLLIPSRQKTGVS